MRAQPGCGEHAVVANVGSLVEKARRERVPVVWVEHSDEQLARGSDKWRIVPELALEDGEPLIEEHYVDSFGDTTLEKVLSGLGVGRLVVVGAQSDACIRSTLPGALDRGYDATLVSAAHTTEDQTEWGAPPRTRSSPTQTCTGDTRRLRAGPQGRPQPRMSTSAAPPDGLAPPTGTPQPLASRSRS